MSQSKKRFGRSRESLESDQKYAITDADRQLTELAAQNLPRNRHTEAFTQSSSRQDTGSTAVSGEGSEEGTDKAAQKTRKSSRERRAAREPQPTPLWYKVVMLGLVVVGLLWIIVFYLSQGALPIPGVGQWNLGIGLAFMLTGLIMTTRWR